MIVQLPRGQKGYGYYAQSNHPADSTGHSGPHVAKQTWNRFMIYVWQGNYWAWSGRVGCLLTAFSFPGKKNKMKMARNKVKYKVWTGVSTKLINKQTRRNKTNQTQTQYTCVQMNFHIRTSIKHWIGYYWQNMNVQGIVPKSDHKIAISKV